MFGRLLRVNCREDNGEESEMQSSAVLDMHKESEHNNDLREHMVGILFSRSKLTHLQKQVNIYI